MTFTLEFYKDKRGKWRWRVRSVTKRIIAESGQGYRRRVDCERMAQRVLTPEAIVPAKGD